jgi:excisionase family DNA binding protein
MVKLKLSKIDFITIRSISNYCGVSSNTVRRWIYTGKLHAIQLPSGHSRVSVQDLKIFLKRNRIPIPKELSQTH